jgi:hypothetical protein
MSRREDRPASPEQFDDGFAEGQERKPDTPEEERPPRFSRGQDERDGRPEEEAVKPRFSRGQEQEDDAPEKEAERRFSEGQERD